MPVWPSTPGYKEQHCGGYTAGQSSCTGQWLTSPAIANTLTKTTVKPRPHEWINKPFSCIFQPEASAKAPSQRAHLSQQYNYKCYSVHGRCAYSLAYRLIKPSHTTTRHFHFNVQSLWQLLLLRWEDHRFFSALFTSDELQKCWSAVFNWTEMLSVVHSFNMQSLFFFIIWQ